MAQEAMNIDTEEDSVNKQLQQADKNTEINKQNNDSNVNIASIAAVRDDLRKSLESIPVSELQFAAKAIVLDSKLNPKKAIETLLQYKIRAAPVINGNQFIGVLDLRDTVKYALKSYQMLQQAQSLKQVNENEQEESKQKDAKQYLLGGEELAKLSLAQLCQHRPFRYVKDNQTLLDVAELFAAGCHVVGVINSNTDKNELIGIITQGYFYQQVVKKWKFESNCSLEEIMKLKYITSPVKSINKGILAYDAFKTMVDNDLSGLAVCDNNGVIVHNTSATDIKLWLLSSHTLENTIEQFLISVRNLSLVERFPVSTCKLGDTFKRAVQMLQATKYHRLWIVNQHRQPLGVLALTDIFQFICKTKEKNN